MILPAMSAVVVVMFGFNRAKQKITSVHTSIQIPITKQSFFSFIVFFSAAVIVLNPAIEVEPCPDRSTSDQIARMAVKGHSMIEDAIAITPIKYAIICCIKYPRQEMHPVH